MTFICGCASNCSVEIHIHGGGGMGNVIISSGGVGRVTVVMIRLAVEEYNH